MTGVAILDADKEGYMEYEFRGDNPPLVDQVQSEIRMDKELDQDEKDHLTKTLSENGIPDEEGSHGGPVYWFRWEK